MSEIKDIPKHWQVKKLGEVCDVIMGQSPSSTTYNSNGIGLPFFQGKAEFTELYPVVEKWCNAPNKIAEPNDVLLSVRAPVGTTNIANQKCCIGRGLAAIRYKNYKYVFYFLRSIEQQLDKKGTGTTFRAISGETIRTTEIPIPPLPEQQAIVSKIEELLSDLENGKQQLQTAQQQLKVYRQSLLKWAFEGKLTNKKVKDGELPKGWKWVKLGEEGKLVSGQHILEKDYNFSKAGIPYFTGPADFGNSFPSVSKWTIHPKVIAKKNDVLITVKGAGVGKINLMHIEEAAISRQLMAFSSSKIDSKYIYNFLSSRFHDFQRLGLGSTVPGIRRDIILNYQMPLCNVKEQQLIVNELESKLTVCDKIEETISQSLKQAEMLRQSILKKAFEGKLVAQNPNDEPAPKLLERIKAESQKN